MIEIVQSIARGFELAVGWVFSPSWLPPADFELWRWLVVPGFGYGILLVVFGVLELVIPEHKRPWSKATLLSTTYVLLAGKMGFYALIIVPAFRKAWLYLGLPSLHMDRILPLPLYMVFGLLATSFVGYWAHRLMHRVPAFWQLHKIHHSVKNLNFASVYHRHFLEGLLAVPGHLTLVLLLGTDLVAPFGLVVTAIDLLAHANVRLNLGWLTYFITTPQAHRVHHSAEARHYDTNFGNVLMIWDHVFGTFHYDPKRPPAAYGVDEDIPLSFVKQQLLPFAWMTRGVRLARDARQPPDQAAGAARPGVTALIESDTADR